MDLLSLLRRCGLAGADGPHRLIGNHDIGPVGDGFMDGCKLSLVDCLRLAGLSLVELLANAGHYAEVVFKSDLDLICDYLVTLTEDVAPL